MPLNADEVLAGLPTVNRDINDIPSAVAEIFLDHLKHLRYGDDESEVKKKRKKLTVEPGKSMG